MLSEKIYWIILILGLGFLVLLIGFVLIPYEILDYNLGLNLISESIGILFTIIFLTWLFDLREKSQWKLVEKEVYSNIQTNVSMLFDKILEYVDSGWERKFSIYEKGDEQARNKACFDELCRLRNSDEIKLNDIMFEIFITTPVDLRDFEDISRNLGNIQDKYSRFFSPKLTICIMKIQEAINGLVGLAGSKSMKEKFEKAITSFSKKAPKIREQLKELDLGLIDKRTGKTFSMLLKALIETIFFIHMLGIELRCKF